MQADFVRRVIVQKPAPGFPAFNQRADAAIRLRMGFGCGFQCADDFPHVSCGADDRPSPCPGRVNPDFHEQRGGVIRDQPRLARPDYIVEIVGREKSLIERARQLIAPFSISQQAVRGGYLAHRNPLETASKSGFPNRIPPVPLSFTAMIRPEILKSFRVELVVIVWLVLEGVERGSLRA